MVYLINIEICLNQITDNVDIYLAVLAPTLNPEIHVLTSNGTFQPLSAGLVPWISNTTGPLNIILLQDFPISALPQGTYTFFQLQLYSK